VSETAADRPAPSATTKAKPTAIDVEAAKLKIVVDRRLGKKTPEWVLRVAQGLPPVAPAS
jgi:hypothetical protein